MAHYNSIRTTVEIASSFDFACASCGHRAHGTIRTEGVGLATVGATSEPAEDAAARRAEKVAQKNFERALLLVRCPSCRQQDPAKVRRYQIGRFLFAVFLVVLFVPVFAYVGWVVSEHAVWGAALGVLAGLALSTQPVMQALRPAEPAVDFAPAAP
jgi:hypothetical protein